MGSRRGRSAAVLTCALAARDQGFMRPANMQTKPSWGGVQSPPGGATQLQLSGSCWTPPRSAQWTRWSGLGVNGTSLPPEVNDVTRGSFTQTRSSRIDSLSSDYTVLVGPLGLHVTAPVTPLVHLPRQATGTCPAGAGACVAGGAGGADGSSRRSRVRRGRRRARRRSLRRRVFIPTELGHGGAVGQATADRRVG